MTIDEVLAQVDELMPNQYDDQIKISWLSKLDAKIFEELIKTHETDEDTITEFNGYSVNDIGAKLIAEDAYADMYVDYLFAMINYSNQELDRYSNCMLMFNEKYRTYAANYNMKHKPLTKQFKLF